MEKILFGFEIVLKNDFSKNMKSKIELFADDVKILVRSLSKETTQMDLKKFSY